VYDYPIEFPFRQAVFPIGALAPPPHRWTDVPVR